MQQTAQPENDRYSSMIAAAKDMAQAIVATCQAYERAASPATLNVLLQQVELLADLAEDLDVARTTRALDRPGGGWDCSLTMNGRG